jgi:hypothetical protein
MLAGRPLWHLPHKRVVSIALCDAVLPAAALGRSPASTSGGGGKCLEFARNVGARRLIGDLGGPGRFYFR